MSSLFSKRNSHLFSFKNKTTLEDRYVYMDGAIHGSKAIRRILSVPCNQINAVLGIFTAAADALLVPVSMRQGTFIQVVPFELSISLLAYGLAWVKFNHQLPVPKESVIDKMGYLPTNPEASAKMVLHYTRNAYTSLSFSAGLYTGSLMSSHNFFNPFPIFCLVHSMWQWRAARKLSKGEWTIQTQPPKLGKKNEHSIGSAASIAIPK